MDKNNPQDLQDKRSVNFSKTLWIALSSIVACFAFLYVFLGHYTPADKIAYDKLVKGEAVPDKSETQVSKQRRTGLQKNIFFNDHHQHLELKLRSAYSELALEKTDRHIEIVEYLQDVTCWLQESVYFVLPDGRQAFQQLDGRLLIKGSDPKEEASWISVNTPGLISEQMILILKAENATYQYKGELFVAKDVKVLRYITPTHVLEEIPAGSKLITDGIASKVEFSLAGKGLDFKSDNFKAKFSLKPGSR